VLLRPTRRHETMDPNGSAAKVQKFNSHTATLAVQVLLSEMNSQLDTGGLHLSTAGAEVLKHKSPARTQHTVCYQAVALYPESFNDHKELPSSSRGTAIVPVLSP
jgi:hypothetical protein